MYVFVYLYVVSVCAITLAQVFLSFHDVGPGLQIQVVQLSGKCLCLLSNLTSLRHNLIHFSMKNLRFWIRQVS